MYLPPPPVTKVLCSESYISRKDIYYHGETERLLTVGHPYFSLSNDSGKVPKVSANQYRVFRLQLPDPNRFALPDKNVHNPSKERLVWALSGIQVSRGQPLSACVTGNNLFNYLNDGENVAKKKTDQGKDDRTQIGLDVKQCQVLLVGCAPALGEYWDRAALCAGAREVQGACPPIELKSKVIEDGNMMEIGYGAANFKTLNANKSEVPLDLVNEISLYPDYLQMSEEATGNRMFFFARKEQSYARHIYTKGGQEKEGIPAEYTIKKQEDSTKNSTFTFTATPSGSLVSTDGQLCNRPYWLYKAQGQNNGVCWNNDLFVTLGDNTRGGNLVITVNSDGKPQSMYDQTKTNIYLRHVEEYKIAIILQLCSVELTPATVSHLQSTIPHVLENWEINVQPPTSSFLEDTYRDLSSAATKCPDSVQQSKPKDPYEKYTFWNIDFKDRLSLDLDQFPLGRRFLATRGLGCNISRKRKASDSPAKKSKRKKAI